MIRVTKKIGRRVVDLTIGRDRGWRKINYPDDSVDHTHYHDPMALPVTPAFSSHWKLSHY